MRLTRRIIHFCRRMLALWNFNVMFKWNSMRSKHFMIFQQQLRNIISIYRLIRKKKLSDYSRNFLFQTCLSQKPIYFEIYMLPSIFNWNSMFVCFFNSILNDCIFLCINQEYVSIHFFSFLKALLKQIFFLFFLHAACEVTKVR